VLAGIYANSAVAAAATFLGSGAGYVYFRARWKPPRYAARALDVSRSLGLAADAGLSGAETARALAPFAPAESLDATLRATGDCAPLIAPAVQSGQLVPHASAYLTHVSAWLVAYLTARDALAAQLRPGGLSTVAMPTLSVFVFVGQLAAIPWAVLTGNDPLIPLVMVGMMLAWLVGLLWQYRLLETFHAGTKTTRAALATALAVARAALPTNDPQRLPLPKDSPTMRHIVQWAIDGRGDNLPAVVEERESTLRHVGEGLTTHAATTDRFECELVVMRYQAAVVLTRAPAMALALAFPLLLVASAIGRVVGP
jgi:hypothetical protein